MPVRLLLSAQSFVAAKTVLVTWLAAALTTFGIVADQSHDYAYAATWASISAIAAALIAGAVRVTVVTITTASGRREQREIERSNDFKRLHEMYAEKLKWAHERLQDETNILRVVRNAKHQLISDIGARDIYIDGLKESLRHSGVAFERMTFRNMAEAFQEEDRQVNAIVKRTLNGNTS